MSEVYSYHTFILPFIWNVEGISTRDVYTFPKCFDRNPNWISTNLSEAHRIGDNGNIISDEDAYLLYAEYQYFNPAARNAIYGFESEIVRNYCFNPALVRNKGKYIIEKKGISYVLSVNAIRLKIYNTGVALFILECENIASPEFAYQNNMAAVKNINDYGRRISLPYIPDDPDASICADRLTLEIEGLGSFSEDTRGFIERTNTKKDVFDRVSLTHMCDFIKKILEYGGDYTFSSNYSKSSINKNTFYIYPALDDRMFSLCVVCDGNAAFHYTEMDDKKEHYLFESNEDRAMDLYELAFVDPAGECSCRDRRMRQDLLEKHIYRRWLPYGTLYTVVNHGFTAVSSFKPTYNAALTQYFQICCLALAQRASIINFQREATALSRTIEKQGKTISTSLITRILDLQERFIAFQNQLCFTEISSQEQAIELYDMITDAFFIEKESEALASHLESLYNAANTNIDFSLNKYGTAIAVTAIFLSLASFCSDFAVTVGYLNGSAETLTGLPLIMGMLGCLGVAAALIAFILFIYRRRK